MLGVILETVAAWCGINIDTDSPLVWLPLAGLLIAGPVLVAVIALR